MKKIVIHYSEIGIKGENRVFFEKQLVNNIGKALGQEAGKVYRRHGRIVGGLSPSSALPTVQEKLERLPGISGFSFAEETTHNLEEIKQKAASVLAKEEFQTFKVKCKRSNKDFPLTSLEVNKQVGEYLAQSLQKKAVMDNPDVRLYIEIGEKEAFVYCRKYPGIGGLPVGSSGRVICSLSGGIDSPVASYFLMKRGCRVIFVHLYNQTQQGEGVISKIKDLVKQLSQYQEHSKLYIVPFEKIQKEIILKIPSTVRMIVYRRFMLKIISRIARIEKAKGIITGDSVGQVASQTLDNLGCIYSASSLPVFSPLIGLNKEEIINIAKQIGTYDYSIQPYPDCCSFMIAQHPETKANLKEINRLEELMENTEKLIEESISQAMVSMI